MDPDRFITSISPSRAKGAWSSRAGVALCSWCTITAACSRWTTAARIRLRLHKGSIRDGILTCPWHHARFDERRHADLWADDVPTAEVLLEDGPGLRRGGPRPARRSGHALAPTPRRRHGAQSGSGDRQGGAGAHGAGAGRNRTVARWGSVRCAHARRLRHRHDHSGRARQRGCTSCRIGAYLCAVPRHPTRRRRLRRRGATALATRSSARPFRRGAPPLVPAVDRGASPGCRRAHPLDRDRAGSDLLEIADIMLGAVTDRPFAVGGHALDFLNKAFECGSGRWRHAILPTVVGQAGRGARRRRAERVAAPARSHGAARRNIRGAARSGPPGEGRQFEGHAALADELLGDDPEAINAALLDANAGATPARPRPRLAYAAALRIARLARPTSSRLGHRVARVHLRHAAHRLLEESKRSAGLVQDEPYPWRCAQCRRWRCISRASSTSRPLGCLASVARRSTICRRRRRDLPRCWTRSTGSSRSTERPPGRPPYPARVFERAPDADARPRCYARTISTPTRCSRPAQAVSRMGRHRRVATY